MPQVPVLAIDGPSGSGKGTVGQILARRLGWHFLDSGALYRLLGLAARRLHVAPDHPPDQVGDRAGDLAVVAAGLEPEFLLGADGEPVRVLWEGEDVSDALRSESCGQMASTVAAIPAVRHALLDRQRALRREPGLVADGRDMGSVVFPDATLKIFLTASREERARRRHKQLKDLGADATLKAILRDMVERDARDSTRSIAPLLPAADAVVIDSTRMNVGEVCGRILGLLAGRVDDVVRSSSGPSSRRTS
jgi:CMP/dCMP kinase